MRDITLKCVFIVSEKGKLCLWKEKRLLCTIVPTVILCRWEAFRLTICVKIFALGRSVSLIFCPANAKLALTLDYNCHWKYHQFHSCFRSSTIKICVVPVRSTCASAKWYRRVSMNHLSVASRFPFCMWQKKRRKARCLHNGFTTWGVINPAVNETLLTYPSSRQ